MAGRRPGGPEIAIIGSGFGGIGMAIRLGQAGFHRVTILEKDERIGGTWRDNTYPGAACDVPAHLYSFSFEPKADWSRRFATQPEILAYLEHCVEKHGLRPRLRLRSEVLGGAFDEATGRWRLRLTGGATLEADVVVSACGQLGRPALPDLPGLETFAGPTFHSARWRHDVPLAGRRVGVLGTGASAIQLVPPVASEAAHLTVFQRTPSWILPKPDRRYTAVEKALFRWLPPLRALHRASIYWASEGHLLGFRTGSWAHRLLGWACRRHLGKSLPGERLQNLRAALEPHYPVGCKRVLISNDFHQTLARPNVTLCTAAVTRVRPDGLETEDGTFHPLDVLCLATGFQATDFLAPMRLVGRRGRELSEAWRDGAEAYLGLAVPGFPNLFLLYGPNTNLAHNSIVVMLEAQFRHVLAALRALEAAGGRWLDLRPERLAEFRDELRMRLPDLVWDEGCTSWYKTAAGRNTNNWPGWTFEYRRRTARVRLADYEVGR